jgi:hypothetical protein
MYREGGARKGRKRRGGKSNRGRSREKRLMIINREKAERAKKAGVVMLTGFKASDYKLIFTLVVFSSVYVIMFLVFLSFFLLFFFFFFIFFFKKTHQENRIPSCQTPIPSHN